MTLEEFKEERAALQRKHIKQLKQLDRWYVATNLMIVRGDFVKDHIGTIKVESISVYYDCEGIPSAAFKGPEYTQKGTPYKNGSIRTVYAENLK